MLSGKSGILNTLQGEHGEVATLMDEVAGTSSDIEKRQKLFAEIRKNVLAHSKGEELEFYPACREYESLEGMTSQATGDHDEVERILGELERLPIDAPGWMDTFGTLKQNVEEHVAFEEQELFPRVEEAIDDDRLRSMDRAYKERKKSVESEISELETQRPGART